MVRIYDFNDMRIYLLAYFMDKQKDNRHFSYTVFGRIVGMNRSLLYSIMHYSNRKIPLSYFDGFSKALSLNAHEKSYFIHMTLYTNSINDKHSSDNMLNKTKMEELRNEYYRKLLA